MCRKLYLLLLGVCFVCGCSTDELLPDFIYEMTLSQENLNIVPEGSQELVEINSNTEWSAESSVDWCKLSATGGGKGKTSFTVTVEENKNIEERLASVTVTAGAVVRTIKIVQLNPDGFEVVGLPEAITVGGLENVYQVEVKTNLALEATSSADWVVSLTNDIVPGNPPKSAFVRVMFTDNTTDAPRSAVVRLNGTGLPESYAKSFTVTQEVAPEADNNVPEVIGTWLTARVTSVGGSELSLLGTTMKFEPNGKYSEVLASGQKSEGSWEVRNDRLGIYYGDSRRYIYITDTENGIEGTMTPTDIHSTVLYEVHLSPYSGEGFGVSLIERTNTRFTYMLLISGDTEGITERGVCFGKSENPTVSDRKIAATSDGAVAVGEITGLLSGETYHLRGYQVTGSGILYTENMEIGMPVQDLDGNHYRIIRIGQQYWMAENLKATRYRDGSVVAYYNKEHNEEWMDTSESKEGAYSWIFGEEPGWQWTEDDFNQGVTDHSAKAYGAFYNWYAVTDRRGLAPEGWHIPSKEEFITLLSHIGASTDDFASGDLNYMNGLLAHDHYQNLTGWTGWAVSGRGTNGNWKGYDSLSARETTWWSTDISDSGYPWLLYHRRGDTGDSGISWTYPTEGWTVRCVRDAE